MATIHPPNATERQVGDYVIHDADAKRADMLMVVSGRNASGLYRTRHAYRAEQPKSWRHKAWRNTVEPCTIRAGSASPRRRSAR